MPTTPSSTITGHTASSSHLEMHPDDADRIGFDDGDHRGRTTANDADASARAEASACNQDWSPSPLAGGIRVARTSGGQRTHNPAVPDDDLKLGRLSLTPG